MALVPAHQAFEDQPYADAQGDIWAFIQGRWRYLIDEGGFTEWETHSHLPDEFGPYLQLSDAVKTMIENDLKVTLGE